jgi:hypothetical protein
MYHSTGFNRDEIIDICALINSVARTLDAAKWPPCLGLFKSTAATLTYLRHNRTQAEIGEALGVSQSTVSRAISSITPLLAKCMAVYAPTADDLDVDGQYIVDGTLLPCWSWAMHPELYSGKHKTTGMNVQVACTLDGRLAWISDPIPGRRHDTYCLRESGVLDGLNRRNWIGDKGYVGNGMMTPVKRKPGKRLCRWQLKLNNAINKVRWKIEQTIAHLKNWAALHTDYRRPVSTFAATISAVIGLHFYRAAE